MYLTIICYCIVPHELLQFYRNEKIREIPACENDEDNFIDITGLLKFYQNNTDGRNSHLPYKNNKKWVNHY